MRSVFMVMSRPAAGDRPGSGCAIRSGHRYPDAPHGAVPRIRRPRRSRDAEQGLQDNRASNAVSRRLSYTPKESQPGTPAPDGLRPGISLDGVVREQLGIDQPNKSDVGTVGASPNATPEQTVVAPLPEVCQPGLAPVCVDAVSNHAGRPSRRGRLNTRAQLPSRAIHRREWSPPAARNAARITMVGTARWSTVAVCFRRRRAGLTRDRTTWVTTTVRSSRMLVMGSSCPRFIGPDP